MSVVFSYTTYRERLKNEQSHRRESVVFHTQTEFIHKLSPPSFIAPFSTATRPNRRFTSRDENSPPKVATGPSSHSSPIPHASILPTAARNCLTESAA